MHGLTMSKKLLLISASIVLCLIFLPSAFGAWGGGLPGDGDNITDSLKNKTEGALEELSSKSVQGAAIPLPESMRDEVEAYKPEIPGRVPSYAFLLLNEDKYYVILSPKDIDKGCGSVEGKLLPKIMTWKGKEVSFILGQEVSISQEGEKTTISKISENPDDYLYKCVVLDTTLREASTLYDPDRGYDIHFPVSTGFVVKNPKTIPEFVVNLRRTSEELVKNPDRSEVKETLPVEKEHLPIFDFETKFWPTSKVNVDAMVLYPEDIRRLAEDKGEKPRDLVYPTRNATLYSLEEEFRPEKLSSIEEAFTRSGELKGKTITFESWGYGTSISVQEEIEHNTQCGKDKAPVPTPQGTKCINIPVDVLLHGVVAFGKVPGKPSQLRKRTLLTVGASSHHQDKPSQQVKGRFRYTGKLVSTEQIDKSLPKGLALITFEREKIGDLDYKEIGREARKVIEQRARELKSVISKGGKVGAVLVSDNKADMAVAEKLASHYSIPMVVTPWGNFRQRTAEELKALKPGLVWIVGEHEAVPEKYRGTLENAGVDYTVYGGETRQQTSLELYKNFKQPLDLEPIVCDGKKPVITEGTIPVYVYNSPESVVEEVKEITEVHIASKGRAEELVGKISNAKVIKGKELEQKMKETRELIEDLKEIGEEGSPIMKEKLQDRVKEHLGNVPEG